MKKGFLRSNFTFLIVLCSTVVVACGKQETPLPTAFPTITPIPSWQKLSTTDSEIWIPGNFIGGTNQTIDKITQEIANLGPEFVNMAEYIRLNKSSITIFAIDPSKNDKGAITNMVVTQETLPGNLLIEDYVDSVLKILSNQYQVTNRDSLPSARYSTEAVIFVSTIPQAGEITQIMYAMKNGGTFWQITFSTPSDEFQERMLIFEHIALSATLPLSPETETQQGNSSTVGLGVILIVISLLLSAWSTKQKKKQDKETIVQASPPKKKRTKRP